jgi:hypothetical protein
MIPPIRNGGGGTKRLVQVVPGVSPVGNISLAGWSTQRYQTMWVGLFVLLSW